MPSTPQYDRYQHTYTSFSGSDISAQFNGVTVGTLSGITWSVTREKAPIYTLGSPNPRSFSRGKRGIAGSLIFTIFDRPALYDLLLAKVDDPNMRFFTRATNVLPRFDNKAVLVNRGIVPVNPLDENNVDRALDIREGLPYYADQIPPFDITITFMNEMGQSAMRSIYGVELLNEGSGASVDDIVIEESMTFVARDVGPMYATGSPRHPSFEMESNALNPNIIIPD